MLSVVLSVAVLSCGNYGYAATAGSGTSCGSCGASTATTATGCWSSDSAR